MLMVRKRSQEREREREREREKEKMEEMKYFVCPKLLRLSMYHHPLQ